MNCLTHPSLVFLAGVLLSAPVAAAADPDALVPAVATYESGTDAGAVRRFEQLLRESVGDSRLRTAGEAALIRLLAPETTFEAKRFACDSLAVYGSEASLPALAALLKQEETVGIACFALGRLPSAQAGDLLRAALAEARGPSRLQLVVALGVRAEEASVKTLAGLARDADIAVARAAIRALGTIDAVSARDALAELRRGTDAALVDDVAAASLNGAERLVAAGDKDTAVKVCEALLPPAFPAHIRRGAFGMLLRSDPDGGLRRMRAVLEAAPSDPVLAPVAIAHLPSVHGEGVSKDFGGLLARLAPPEQVLLVEALACRGDAEACAVIRTQVGAKDPGVRRAAFKAVGRLEDASAVALLAQALKNAATPEEAKEIQLALAGLGGGETTGKAIGELLRQATAKEKLPLIAALSQRGGSAAVSVLLEQTGDSDKEVSRAAGQALVRIAGSGDSAALAVLQEAVAGGDPRIREAALRTLAAWRGDAAWETLLGIYRKPENDAQRTLALRGLVKIAGDGNAQPDGALIGRYRQLLAGAQSDAQRKMILNVLAGVAHPDALALARPLVDVPGLRVEAAQAVERITQALQKTQPK
jgi:HEAT repeat protein